MNRPRARRSRTRCGLGRVSYGLLLSLLLGAAPAEGGAELRHGVEVLVGAPINGSTPLVIRQDGQESLRFDASYRTEPFRVPIYWALRLSRERDETAWSLEFMHHKLLLNDPPDEVQSFSISHGFNFVTVQRAWPVLGSQFRVGLGAVLAHPENEVRGRRLSEEEGAFGFGYYLAGPATLVAWSRRVPAGGRAALSLEARGSVARARVPVVDGEARFTHVAVHLLFGVAIFPF